MLEEILELNDFIIDCGVGGWFDMRFWGFGSVCLDSDLMLELVVE